MNATKLKRLRAAGWKVGGTKDFLKPEMSKRKTLVADALTAEKEVARTGKAYPAGRVHRYLRARVTGRKATRPKPAPW